MPSDRGSDVADTPTLTAALAAADMHVSVEELVAGMIAAHDLASASRGAVADSGVAVQVQLERTLRSAGVDRLPVADGDMFDPAFHMVADTEPAPQPDLERRVAREIRAGWTSANGLVRPAEVVVWTGSA